MRSAFLLVLVVSGGGPNLELSREQVRKTVFCGIQFNHATSDCVLIVANNNKFAVTNVRVEVELGSPDQVIEHKTITIKQIGGKRFALKRFKPKSSLGSVPVVGAKAFSAKRASKKESSPASKKEK